MAGDYRSKKEAAYLLVPAVGRKVIDLGGNLEKGVEILLPVTLFMRLIRALAPILKLIGNSLILGIIEVMSESITMGEKAGLGAPAVLGVINGKLLRSLAHACLYLTLLYQISSRTLRMLFALFSHFRFIEFLLEWRTMDRRSHTTILTEQKGSRSKAA